jgi:predicted CxxxxCH...CXXCH cytochrome family protein
MAFSNGESIYCHGDTCSIAGSAASTMPRWKPFIWKTLDPECITGNLIGIDRRILTDL